MPCSNVKPPSNPNPSKMQISFPFSDLTEIIYVDKMRWEGVVKIVFSAIHPLGYIKILPQNIKQVIRIYIKNRKFKFQNSPLYSRNGENGYVEEYKVPYR